MFAYKEEVPCLYVTSKDLEDRLSGTICRYEGKPVYITIDSELDETRLRLYDPRTVRNATKPDKIIDPDDPNLDISMFECRYINYESEYYKKNQPAQHRNFVIYQTRNPKKQWKQGYSAYATISKNFDGTYHQQFDNETMMYSDGVYDSLSGVYPSYEEVLQKFADVEAGTVVEYAISPDVALRKSEVGVVFIFYRCLMVGWIAPDSKVINVTNTELAWVIRRYLSRLKLV